MLTFELLHQHSKQLHLLHNWPWNYYVYFNIKVIQINPDVIANYEQYKSQEALAQETTLSKWGKTMFCTCLRMFIDYSFVLQEGN